MDRYRLTFDANPKELARRDSAGTHVALLWSRRRQRAAVVVAEDATGEIVQLDIRERENPLELYDHPYAYTTRRGHPGKPTTVKEVSCMAKKRHEKRELRKEKRDR